ncbi:discoidin domain-containing protein [Demequina oxidasica]|uniref:discoidin domain-containing protein n=1 Tax=Demequina oxidasica TaxID=676199 RepID=UPI000AB38E0F|nr:discoidin domain-containing protein [Demequina oxidasica]
MTVQTSTPRPRPRGRSRALISCALATLVATPLVVLPTTAASAAAPTLLSQGQPTTATSTENADYTPASAAVDGDLNTRWSSNFADQQDLTVELAQASTLDHVALSWEGAYGKGYEIQVSDDGTQWTTAATVTDGNGGDDVVDLSGAQGKFVRFHGTERGTGYGYSLWEFQVFGSAGVDGGGDGGDGGDNGGGATQCGSDDVALLGTATADSFENEDYYPASNAVDGKADTRWASGTDDDAALTVDLGQSTAVCGVDLDWEGAYGKGFKIQLSNNGSSWTTAATVTDGSGGDQSLAVEGEARYVRFQGVERGTGYGYSLWEFAVRGAAADGGGDGDGGDGGGDGDNGGGDGDNGGGEHQNPYPDYVNAGWGTNQGALTGTSHVEVVPYGEGWRLEVNGDPYTVRGLTWGPDFSTADHYMPTLAAMGANTTRTWGTGPDTATLLDSAANKGVRVIMGFWLVPGGGPGSGGCVSYQGASDYKTEVRAHILDQVNAYKSHPGVLMWSVGNESILGMGDCYSGAELEAERNAYTTFVNDMAIEIHAIDADHPVSSTDAWTGAWAYYKANSPDLDLLQLNSYGDVCNTAQVWEDGGYDRPYIITEGGADGEWEVPDDINGIPDEPTDIEKGAAYVDSWKCIMEHKDKGLGATFFHFGTEGDFGGVWFNVLPGDNKRLGYYALAKTWGKNIDAMNTPPEMYSMEIPGSTSIEAGQKFTVKTDVVDPDGDDINYVMFLNSKYINGAGGLAQVDFNEISPGTFEATAPETLGVWKVYVFAEDGNSNVGVDTRSIRVVAPQVTGTNIAEGKPATASSFDPYNGDFTPKQAFDGNPATRWSSDWNDNEWVQVDLGSVQSFDKVQLVWETAFGSAYEIQTSNDGNSWTTVGSETAGNGGIDSLDVSGSGRYVRLALSDRGTEWGYSLFEMGVYRN